MERSSRFNSRKSQRILVTTFFSYFLASALVCTPPSEADGTFHTFDTPRFTLHIGTNEERALKQPAEIEEIAEGSLKVLNNTFEELSRIFDRKPDKKVVLRLLTPEEFRKHTGAPSWTSAMYYKGEISVPLSTATGRSKDDLYRALRHEYVHAFIADMSGHRCPAWLDEGVAQLIEGKPNPILGPALRSWVDSNEAIPLTWLHNGFTTLDHSLVPAAYAESLFATRTLVNQYGFDSIKDYLLALKNGAASQIAFHRAFRIRQRDFEAKLNLQLKRWASSEQQHP